MLLLQSVQMDMTLGGTSGEQKKAGTAVSKEVSHTRVCCSELVERLENDLAQMRQTLDNKERYIDELQGALNKEQNARSLLYVELNQAKTTSTEQEKHFTSTAAQMHRTIIDKDQLVDEIRKELKEEQNARTSVNEELKQTRVAYSELEKTSQNDLQQMRKTLDAREKAVGDLQRKLEEERLTRAAVDGELSKARIAYIDLEERLQNDLAQLHATLGGKDNAIDKLQKDLEEEQKMRTAIERDFSHATNNHLQLEQRWKNQNEELYRSLNEKQETVNGLQKTLHQAITTYDNEVEEVLVTLDNKERIINELERENCTGRGAASS